MTDEIKIKYDIRTAINEELSINNDVTSLSNSIFNTIKDIFSHGKTTNIKKNGYVECKGNFYQSLNGYKINVCFTIFNFRSNEDYEQNIEYLSDNFSYATKADKKLYFLTVYGYAVNNKLQVEDIVDSIQHEVEHIFQGSIGKKSLNTNDNLYLSAINHINDGNILGIIANTIYFSYDYEQDAIVNGLYAQLMSSENPVPRWDDIVDTQIYDSIEFLKKSILVLSLKKHWLQDKCRNTFGITIDNVILNAKKAYKRLINKVGKVLIKVNKDRQINEGFIFRAASNGKYLFFLD